MLSSEAHNLTRLLLARQTLICRATELDAQLEVATLTPEVYCWQTFAEMKAEAALLPALLLNLNNEIEAARRRLYAVSPASP
jgi:hypothetical protein